MKNAGSVTVTSASGPFLATDLGSTIEAATIPAGTTMKLTMLEGFD